MKLFITEIADNKKCSECNEERMEFYGIGKTKKDARARFNDEDREFYKEYGRGMCGHCMSEYLLQNKAKIEGVE